MNSLQQLNLKTSITIRGLPGNLPRDQSMKVVKNLGAILGIDLTPTDFSSQPYIVYPVIRKKVTSWPHSTICASKLQR